MKLDDNPLDFFGLYLRQGHVHPTPETRDKTMQVPGMHGSWDYGADLGNRNFIFPLAFREKNNVDLQKRIRDFTAFLLDSEGKPRTIKLELDYEPNTFYYVRYSGQFSPERLFGKGKFDLPLTAFDPFAYAEIDSFDPDEDYFYDTGLLYDSGLMYDNTTEFQWIYIKHYSGIYNYSNRKVPLNLTISGVVTNPKITNQTTGETMSLPSLTSSTDVLEIDSDKYTVKLNGKNTLKNISGVFLFLVSGENSLLFEGDSPNATVTYRWKHKFM